LLTNAPSLRIAYPDKNFVVCIDSCKEGLDGVLMQEVQVVFYESSKLNEHAKNYVTHDLELATIMHAMKMWRHYLLGRKFILMTSHGGLKHLFEQPKLNATQERWLNTLNEFDFEARCIKVKEKKVANALSRRIQLNHLEAIHFYEVDLVERVKNVGQHDEMYQEIKEKFQ